VRNPIQKGLTLDVKGGRLGSLAAEWASIPFYKYTDTAGTIFTKIPGLEFPVDSNGNFALSRNLTAYGSSALSDAFRSALASGAALPQSTNAAGIFSPLLNAQSPQIYQEGKILGNLSSSLAVKVFESRSAYGFSMGGAARLEKIPQYYKEVGSNRIAIKESEAPTALVNAKFGSSMQTSGYIYQEPSWWQQSPAASGDLTANLRDGSQVTYRWYKFVDQPSLQRFEMNAVEKAGIQGAIEKMQNQWNNFAMMKDPTVGSLVSFDEGLMVTPPKGLEVGYVPIVVKQKAADKSAVDKALAAISLASNNIESIMRAAADKAAADKAVADKAVADKAVADKAVADKAVADKAVADKAVADKAVAVKKLTITCVKGKIIKKVTAAKPKCPTGFKKK
jgi:Tfp pilus assembly major pilin PilA